MYATDTGDISPINYVLKFNPECHMYATHTSHCSSNGFQLSSIRVSKFRYCLPNNFRHSSVYWLYPLFKKCKPCADPRTIVPCEQF